MELKLRPEHWILLAILAVCLVLLALQLAQSWSFPALARLTQAIETASSEPGPEAPPASPQPDAATEEDSGADAGADRSPSDTGEPTDTAGESSSSAAGATDPGEAQPEETQSNTATQSDAGADFDLVVWPDPITLADSVSLVVHLKLTDVPVEISFELIYDAAALAFVPAGHEALEALATQQGPPEMTVDSSADGRLKVRLHQKTGTPPATPASPQLCYVSFTPLRSGTTSVQLVNAESRLTDGKPVRLSDSKKSLQIQ